jgi:hypothetical protein
MVVTPVSVVTFHFEKVKMSSSYSLWTLENLTALTSVTTDGKSSYEIPLRRAVSPPSLI